MRSEKIKIKNRLKNLLLNYGAHLDLSYEYGPWHTGRHSSPPGEKNVFRKGAVSFLHRQSSICKGIANVTQMMDALFGAGACLLVVNGTANAFPMRRPGGNSIAGEWINGTCSNWKAVCHLAWNSYLLKSATAGQCADTLLNRWLSQAASSFSGLHILSHNGTVEKTHSKKFSASRLTYKQKPDCILLLNPEKSTMEECRALAVPLCICRITYPFKGPAISLEANAQSCFLIYLMLHSIGYSKQKF